MGYRTFGDGTTLDGAIEDCFFTTAALDAHADKAVRDLARPLSQHLAAGKKLAIERREANDARIRASALVRMRDGDADDAARDFSKDVLAAVRQNREAPLFRLLLGRNATELVAMSLAPELEAIDAIVQALGDKNVPADLRKQWSLRWKNVVAAGREALRARDDAARAAASLSVAVEQWIARADKLRRAIDGALVKYAADHDLPSDFEDRFFAAIARARRSKKAAPAETKPATA